MAPTTAFVALYRGSSIADARFVSASADSELVESVAAFLLRSSSGEDPALEPIAAGRRQVLRAVLNDAQDADGG